MSSPFEHRYNQQQKERIHDTLKPFIPKDLLNIFASYACIGPARYVFDGDAFHEHDDIPRIKYISDHVHEAIFSSDDLPWIVRIDVRWLSFIFVLSPQLSKLSLEQLVAHLEPTIEPYSETIGIDWTPVRFDGQIIGHAVSISEGFDDEDMEFPFPIHAQFVGMFDTGYTFYLATYDSI